MSDSPLQFRWLLPEEFGRLEEIFTEENWAIPKPEVAQILIAEDIEGQIKYCSVVQSVIHIGPGWIAKEYRGQGIWKAPMEVLRRELQQYFGGVLLIATNPAAERIAEFLEMKRGKGVLFVKDFPEGEQHD